MGCFQSIPKSKGGKENGIVPVKEKVDLPCLDFPVHEFFEVQNEPIVESEAIQGNTSSVEDKFFDPELMSDFNSSVCSPCNDLVSSAIVELPESVEDGSSDCSRRPVSPEFVVSPDPGSPARVSPLPNQANRVEGLPVSKLPESPIKAEEFKSATATPLQTCVVPPVSVRPRSRILDVAETRNKLEAAGKASQIILNDNLALKARVTELEHAITVVQSVPMKTESTTTEDLQNTISVPSTPPVRSHMLSGFATPLSNPVSAAEYATPPSTTTKLSWEDYLRPSAKEQNLDSKKVKLRSISEDLSRLSESLSAVELKHRRPLNDANQR